MQTSTFLVIAQKRKRLLNRISRDLQYFSIPSCAIFSVISFLPLIFFKSFATARALSYFFLALIFYALINVLLSNTFFWRYLLQCFSISSCALCYQFCRPNFLKISLHCPQLPLSCLYRRSSCKQLLFVSIFLSKTISTCDISLPALFPSVTDFDSIIFNSGLAFLFLMIYLHLFTVIVGIVYVQPSICYIVSVLYFARCSSLPRELKDCGNR